MNKLELFMDEFFRMIDPEMSNTLFNSLLYLWLSRPQLDIACMLIWKENRLPFQRRPYQTTKSDYLLIRNMAQIYKPRLPAKGPKYPFHLSSGKSTSKALLLRTDFRLIYLNRPWQSQIWFNFWLDVATGCFAEQTEHVSHLNRVFN